MDIFNDLMKEAEKQGVSLITFLKKMGEEYARDTHHLVERAILREKKKGKTEFEVLEIDFKDAYETLQKLSKEQDEYIKTLGAKYLKKSTRSHKGDYTLSIVHSLIYSEEEIQVLIYFSKVVSNANKDYRRLSLDYRTERYKNRTGSKIPK